MTLWTRKKLNYMWSDVLEKEFQWMSELQEKVRDNKIREYMYAPRKTWL